MSDNVFLNETCRNFRLNYDSEEPEMTSVELVELRVHGEQCSDCAKWVEQIESLVQHVSAAPQFDVPESVTQRVLASVGRERKRQRMTGVGFAAVSVVTFGAVLIVCPLDSLDGLCSWVICGLLVAGFGMIARKTTSDPKLVGA